MQSKNKKAAIEMSVGTIIIIVLGITMLILGMVLVRSVMCKAIGLTTDVNDKIKVELDKYFSDSGGEVACIGSGGEPIKVLAGKTNFIYCSIHAPEQAQYQVTLSSSKSIISSLTDTQLNSWVKVNSWSGTVAPGDQTIKKVITLQIPENAPEGSIRFQVEIKKNNNELVSTQDLDFEVSRVGTVRNVVC